jgi:hypothetical protein
MWINEVKTYERTNFIKFPLANHWMQSLIPPHGKNLKIKNTFENFGIHELSQAQKELDNKNSKPHE